MTTSLLETLRALAPVVTPGEWIASESDMFGDHNIQWKEGVETDTDHRAIAAVVSNLRPRQQVEANAQLIVTLRNALPAIIAALEIAELVRSVPQILPAAKLDEVAASAVDWDGSDIPENEPAKWETEAGVIRDMVAEIRAYRAIIAALPKETNNG